MAEPLRAADPPDGVAAGLRYLDRELSWLDFCRRLLDLADDALPLLERAKFLAIFSENLDEIYQVRVPGLRNQIETGLASISGALAPAEQLDAIRRLAIELADRQGRIFLDDVLPELAAAGIVLCDWDDLDKDDRAQLDTLFEDRLFPVLTPLAVDPGHPFPHISNLSLNLAVIVVDAATGMRRFARVKVPPLLPRFVALPDGRRFVPLEQVIAAHLDALFPGMQIERHHTFRVVRNADLSVDDDEADDLLEAVELELRRRRSGDAVRLEVEHDMDDEVLTLLVRELELEDDDVFHLHGPLGLTDLWELYGLERPDLKDEPWTPVTHPRLANVEDETGDIFDAIREGDLLVHHPYESFATSIEEFVKQAASDPQVLAIKQTLYRTSGDSPIAKALIRAAERGKEVAVLVELKARFDEEANIAWARALEDAGVHVVYGLVGLKTHSKTALVVREEADGIRRYCHIGTGNYNPTTARLYEDIGILTASPALGADLTDLFNYLTGYSRRQAYRKLLVAPLGLRERIVDLIGEQAAAGGRIVMKMNNLVDETVIDALYAAAQQGASIDLVVRRICALRPGVPGLSENVRVRSIVGRYLEHSRIFAFGHDDETTYFIGSADMMQRNLDRRVEALVPVEAPELRARLAEILAVNLADDVRSWELRGDGTWARVPRVEGVEAHRRLQELATERARRTREPELFGTA